MSFDSHTRVHIVLTNFNYFALNYNTYVQKWKLKCNTKLSPAFHEWRFSVRKYLGIKPVTT